MAKNLLWIVADQWRADHLGILGKVPVETPNLDRLAQRSLTFTAHYAQAAPCGPSRASMYTGQYPQRHGSWRNGVPADPALDNWALALRREGYAAAVSGYTHFALPGDAAAERYWPRDFEGILPGLEVLSDFRIDHRAWHAWMRERGVTPPASGDERAWGLAEYPFAHSDTAFIADGAIRYLRSRGEQPWALHVSFFRPHDPYFVASDLGHLIAPREECIRGLASLDAMCAAHPYFETTRDDPKAAAPENANDLAAMRAHYRASVYEMDAGVGAILAALDEGGLRDDTLIVVTADHGDQLGDHHLAGKLGLFDQSFNVPLIVCDPGSAADATRGTTCAEPTEAVDLVPTVLDALCGHGATGPGRSLRPLLGARVPADWRSAVGWGYDYSTPGGAPRRLHAIRTAHRLYVEFTDLPPFMIDYENDGEDGWVNRADDPAYAEERHRLAQFVAERRA